MKYIKLFEENPIFKFKIEKDDDNFEVKVFFEGREKILAGSITFQKLFGDSGWYWFEGLLTQDQYDDLFEDIPFVILEHIKVDKYFQKSGLGSELMNRALELISKMGIKLIVLNASPLGDDISLDNLVSFYKKFGFKIFRKQGKNNIMIKRN